MDTMNGLRLSHWIPVRFNEVNIACGRQVDSSRILSVTSKEASLETERIIYREGGRGGCRQCLSPFACATDAREHDGDILVLVE